jgi:hypothetical protein
MRSDRNKKTKEWLQRWGLQRKMEWSHCYFRKNNSPYFQLSCAIILRTDVFTVDKETLV